MQEIILFESKSQMEQQVKERSIITIAIDLKKYCLTRIGNEVFVFETKCPHFDHPLKEAKVSPLGKVTCTWHNYQFDLHDGRESEQRCRSLESKNAHWNQSGQLMIEL